MNKKFVIDTSVLLNDEDSLFKFKDNEVIIPSIVWEELNNQKDFGDSIKSYLPRKWLRLFTELATIRPLREGVKLCELSDKSIYYEKVKDLQTLIRIDYNINNDEVDNSFTLNKHDYKIIGCTKNNCDETGEAILITADIGQLGISKDFVKSEEYNADEIKNKEVYKGYKFVDVISSFIVDFYRDKIIEDQWQLHQNEFVIFKNIENEKNTAIGIKKKDKIKLIDFEKDLNLKLMKVKPINLEQKMLLYLLQDPDILCVTVTGISGKGKTLLSCDYAFSEIEKGLFTKFLYTKSIIPTDEDEYMGYNKGSEEEKFSAHIKALHTAIEFLYRKEIIEKKEKTLNEKIQELVDKDKLGTLPLANIRGMNIYKKIVMLDEAQNTKKHVMKSLVSRLTDESKLIVTGDIEQIDDPKLNQFNNGLSHLIEKGKDEEFIGHITLDIDKGSTKRGKLSTFGAKKL